MEKSNTFYFYTAGIKEKPQLLFNGLEVIDHIIAPNAIDEIILKDKNRAGLEDDIKIEKIQDRHHIIDQKLRGEKLSVLCNQSYNGLTALTLTATSTFFIEPSVDISNYTLSIPGIYIANDHQKYDIVKRLIESFEPFLLYFNNNKQNFAINMHGDDLLGLPKLANFMRFHIDPWFTPQAIAWINYWDKHVAEKCGVKYEEDKSLFYKVEQLNNGGLLFQITETPPDVDNAEHLEKIRAIYKRYPVVGGQIFNTI